MIKYVVLWTLMVSVIVLHPSLSQAAVTVSSPVSGNTYSNPVNVVALAKEKVAINQMQVWDNGVKLGYYPGSSVNQSYTLSNGAHQITVEDLNNKYAVIHKTVVNISVAASPSPSPSAAAGACVKVPGWPAWTNAIACQTISNPTPAPWSAAAIAWYKANSDWGVTTTNVAVPAPSSGDWAFPIYTASNSDPTVTLKCELYGTCATDGTILHVPANAQPQNGASQCTSPTETYPDCHMSVFTPDLSNECDFWEAAGLVGGGSRDGEIGSGACFPTNGTGFNDAWNGSAIAGGFALGPTLLTAEDLASGSINHAMYMVMSCTANYAVSPVLRQDATVCAGTGSTTAAPLGGLLSIAMTDAQIKALGLAPTTTMALIELEHYGWYIGDTAAGSTPMSLPPTSAANAAEAAVWSKVITQYNLPSVGSGYYNAFPGIDTLPASVLNAMYFVTPQ